MKRFPLLLGAAFLAASASSCGGSSQPGAAAPDPMVQADQRLQGSWVLTEFRPAKPLEPMLAALLAAQMGRLTLAFEGGNVQARGMGVTAQRTYRVTEAEADRFSAVIVDPTGLEYQISGSFHGPDLLFASYTPPWRGSGRLQRADR